MSSTATPAAERETRVDLALEGMTCAACATRIERKLNKLDGVEASVNYATEQAASGENLDELAREAAQAAALATEAAISAQATIDALATRDAEVAAIATENAISGANDLATAQAEAAARELVEETGYTAGRWRMLGHFWPSPGVLDEKMHLFVAEDLTPGAARPEADDQWPVLESITAPTLLLRGSRSDVLTSDDAERMVKAVPDARLVEIADAGHSIAVDQPSRFLGAIAPFLLD